SASIRGTKPIPEGLVPVVAKLAARRLNAKCRNGGSPAKLPAPIVASSSSGVSQLKGPSQDGQITEHSTPLPPLQPLPDCIAAFPKWTVTQSVGTANAANLRLITYTKLTSIKQNGQQNFSDIQFSISSFSVPQSA
ncbi:MAG: hypothetical protein Q9214_004323, partial [Letrouitia sp. 1 TL-2023]